VRNRSRSDRYNADPPVGVGELRAVAERLLETGARVLDQGREWLHAATRRQAEEEGAYRRDWPGAQRHNDGPYAPDEYSFSETGGVFDARGGRPDEGPGAHGFEADLDDPLHRHARPGRGWVPRYAGQARPRHRHGAWDDAFVPGSYGFGGEGRHQPGEQPDPVRATADRWERAYHAQGRTSYRGRGPRGYVRTDERILEDVNEQLCEDAIVDASDIEVHCAQGHVVLSGRVPTRWMKHRAEDIADSVRGVKDVDNRIRVAAEEPVAQGDFDTRRATGGQQDAADAGRTGQEDRSSTPQAAATGTGARGSGSRSGTATDRDEPDSPSPPHQAH
jgi:hypothetical protein